MIQFLNRLANGWVALGALAIFLLFTGWALPAQSRLAEEEIGSPRSPDLSFYYTSGDLYQMADEYGASGRAAYIRARFSFDLVWPIVYAFFLASGIGWTFSNAFDAGSRWQRASILPLLGAGFDYLENISTSLVMGRYPDPTAVVDLLAPIFTLIKWLLIAGSFTLLLIGIVLAVWRWAATKIDG